MLNNETNSEGLIQLYCLFDTSGFDRVVLKGVFASDELAERMSIFLRLKEFYIQPIYLNDTL